MPSSHPIVAFAVLFVLSTVACAAPGTRLRPEAPAAVPGEGRAVVVVRVEKPWYAPRFVIRGKFRDVLPEYEAIAPLEAKYFTITDEGEFGGIYLWGSRRAAEDHFDSAWHAKVRAKRGVDADVLVADAAFVIEGRALPDGKPEGARSLAYPAWASFVRITLPEAADPSAAAKALAGLPWSDAALIKALVVVGPGLAGVVALWATREAAEAAVRESTRAALRQASGGTASSFTLFEAPLLVDARLRAR